MPTINRTLAFAALLLSIIAAPTLLIAQSEEGDRSQLQIEAEAMIRRAKFYMAKPPQGTTKEYWDSYARGVEGWMSNHIDFGHVDLLTKDTNPERGKGYNDGLLWRYPQYAIGGQQVQTRVVQEQTPRPTDPAISKSGSTAADRGVADRSGADRTTVDRSATGKTPVVPATQRSGAAAVQSGDEAVVVDSAAAAAAAAALEARKKELTTPPALCKGVTPKGQPCHRRVEKGEEFCWKHKK